MGATPMLWAPAVVIVVLGLFAFSATRSRALADAGGDRRLLHSTPGYHGAFGVLCTAAPALLFWLLFSGASPGLIDARLVAEAPVEVQSLPPERLQVFLAAARTLATEGGSISAAAPGVAAAAERWTALTGQSRLLSLAAVFLLGLAGFVYARSQVGRSFRARNRVEQATEWVLLACSTVAVLVTAGIVLSLIFEAARFFARVPATDFLFGLHWSPQTALRPDQVGSSGAFGVIPVFAGTLLITAIAMSVAVPIGLLSAIYLADYAGSRTRAIAKPLLEVLAGIPTVVYGFFAALTIAPAIRGFGEGLGLTVASESALAAGLVMGVMIIPFVSSLSDDVINAVPQSLRDGSFGLGATKSETIRLVVLPAALPGIVASILLAVSRAIGETMIVVMAAGLAAKLTVNPLDAVTTVTVQIVTLLVGDQEFDSAKTLAAFALGLMLFIVTLCLNVVALVVVRRYREIYD